MSVNSKFIGVIMIIFLVGLFLSIEIPAYKDKFIHNNMSCFFYEKKCYFEEGNCGERVDSCSSLEKQHQNILDMVVPKKIGEGLFHWLLISIRLVIIVLAITIFNKMVFGFIKPTKKFFIEKRMGRILINRINSFAITFCLSFLFFVAMPMLFYFVLFVC